MNAFARSLRNWYAKLANTNVLRRNDMPENACYRKELRHSAAASHAVGDTTPDMRNI